MTKIGHANNETGKPMNDARRGVPNATKPQKDISGKGGKSHKRTEPIRAANVRSGNVQMASVSRMIC